MAGCGAYLDGGLHRGMRLRAIYGKNNRSKGMFALSCTLPQATYQLNGIYRASFVLSPYCAGDIYLTLPSINRIAMRVGMLYHTESVKSNHIFL